MESDTPWLFPIEDNASRLYLALGNRRQRCTQWIALWKIDAATAFKGFFANALNKAIVARRFPESSGTDCRRREGNPLIAASHRTEQPPFPPAVKVEAN